MLASQELIATSKAQNESETETPIAPPMTSLPHPTLTLTLTEDPYFQHLKFEGTFGQVLQVFRERYAVFLGITTLVYMVGWAVAVAAAYTLGGDLQIDGFSVSVNLGQKVGGYDENGDYYYEESTAALWQVALYGLECTIYYCFLCIAHGTSVWLAAHLYLEQRPPLMDGVRQAARNLWPLITSLLLVGCSMLIPSLLVVLMVSALPELQALVLIGMVVYATWLQIIFYHAYPAIMVEHLGPVQSLERSYYLTEDHRCYIFGVLFCWALIRMVVGVLIDSIKFVGYPNGWVWYLGCTLDTGFGILFAAFESVYV
jgi:hypothetical protein